MKNSRILFIDNIRIFLISLVVLHHLSITYGALGGWYYKEVEGDMLTTLILTMFTAANQSFFMGLFFLISAYFTRISLEKKPIGIFIKDRLIRLGIPLLMYYFMLSPLTIYMKLWLVNDVKYSFLEFIEKHGGFGFGPMWFVETLIYFSFIYLVYKIIRGRDHRIKTIRKFPGNLSVILTILAISTVSFAVRLWFPLGSEIPETGLQLPYFPQYIAMLVFGVLFARNGWFNSITYKQGLAWFSFVYMAIVSSMPLGTNYRYFTNDRYNWYIQEKTEYPEQNGNDAIRCCLCSLYYSPSGDCNTQRFI